MAGCATWGIAAQLADEYTRTVNGVVYGDWFLPSKGELNQMYVNKTAIGGFASAGYWSSSEYDAGTAWYQYFGLGGTQANLNKWSNEYVRPVRVF